ncbi:cysteine hydrolase [Mucilaginibacter robiniae]|uniref:Cysteine hydrolase n=1 Tax=Mucilaginibacter robiniae TaxID=2728022 RepID=A0A7L5E0C7_9SPHI|nr:isochorismatase family cysteine hydrolase [Mucilaginibacter robiniae]QJD96822.1 cysteine hydrolase [Mucilaginibacter robiniae]
MAAGIYLLVLCMVNDNNDVLLVIIDPQNDFTHLDGAYAKKNYGLQQISRAKTNIIKLMEEKGHIPVVIVQSDYRPHQFEEGLSMGIPGTFGHQIDIPLDEAVTVIIKTAHSAFTSQSFTDHLKTQGYRKLFIAGFLAEYCVKETAEDALKNGFEVILINDCIGTGDSKQQVKIEVLEELKLQGAKVR